MTDISEDMKKAIFIYIDLLSLPDDACDSLREKFLIAKKLTTETIYPVKYAKNSSEAPAIPT